MFPSLNVTPSDIVTSLGKIATFQNIPSFLVLAIIAIIILFLFKIGSKVLVEAGALISRFLLPVIIVGTMVTMIPYYSKVELPKIFVEKTYNVTLNKTIVKPNYNIIKDINRYAVWPFAYWDRVMYYEIKERIDVSYVITPFILLFMFYFYLVYTFYKRMELLAPIFACLLLWVLTAGGFGMLEALKTKEYVVFPFIVAIFIIFYYIFIGIKRLLT